MDSKCAMDAQKIKPTETLSARLMVFNRHVRLSDRSVIFLQIIKEEQESTRKKRIDRRNRYTDR